MALARRPHTAWLALPVGACATSSTTHLPPSTFEPTLTNLVRLWRCCCRDHESGLEADFTQALSGCAHHLRPRRSSARLLWVLHPPAIVGRLLRSAPSPAADEMRKIAIPMDKPLALPDRGRSGYRSAAAAVVEKGIKRKRPSYRKAAVRLLASLRGARTDVWNEQLSSSLSR